MVATIDHYKSAIVNGQAKINVAGYCSSYATAADAGKWSTTVRLLGVTGTEQKLTGTITFKDGAPTDMTLAGNLSTSLIDFNTDKKTPCFIAS